MPDRQGSTGRHPKGQAGRKLPMTSKRAGGVTFVEVTAVAVKLPDVEVSKSYGTPALKVRDKLLARLKEDGETLVLRMDFVARQILTQADPDTFYFTDHYRDYPLVLVR